MHTDSTTEFDKATQVLPQDSKDSSRLKRNWEKIIAEQKMSGMTMKEYCHKHQLSLSSFKNRKYHLKNKTKNGSGRKSKFIPLQLISNDEPINKKRGDIRINFKNGHSINVMVPDLNTMLFIIKEVAVLVC